MKIFKWSGSLFIFLLWFSVDAVAQVTPEPLFENSHNLYSNKTAPIITTATGDDVTSSAPIVTDFNLDVAMPAELKVSKRKIINASLLIKTNLGDEYNYGPSSASSNAPLDFKYKISFHLKAYDGAIAVNNVFDQVSYAVIIENDKPEAAFVKNLSQYSDVLSNAVSASDLSFQRIAISNVTITPLITSASNASTQAIMLASIANKIRFEISYDIEYGIDATADLVKPIITPLGATKQISKQIIFSWDNGGYQFPNYEFQLLRLFNTKETTAASDKIITAEVDWSKALKIETQSSATALSLTIAEGSGFYVWRVRPIGTYYEGGIANDLNYSENSWSICPLNQKGLALQFADNTGVSYAGAGANPFFYYEDASAGKNYIYSRIFTEGNKVHENVTYATPLQQVRQTQSYKSSTDKTLVTQTVPDNTGRPALTTMNVPVPGKVGDYKEKVVQKDGTDKVYTADDYDSKTNYNNPSKVKQDQTPLSYYSDQNPDVNIPNAEGYPFQRTLFYNDGTPRVKEQSGVGKTNMIGDGTNNNGQGKTAKTSYSTASESDLIALFGDEAPDAESVLKTVSVDQNNTTSVTYTSKEGNVIATGLAFEDAGDNVLEPLNGEPAAGAGRTVNDVIKRNVLTEKGFVSSKRIALLQPTKMDISYKVKCQILSDNCLDLELNCKYKVKLIIHNVDNPANTIVLVKDLTNEACADGDDGEEYKSISWPQQDLAAGTYIIEKSLEPGDPELEIESKEKAEKQIMPLVNLVNGWLDNVQCDDNVQEFYDKLKGLENDVNNAFNSGGCNPTCFAAKYNLGDFLLVQRILSQSGEVVQAGHLVTIGVNSISKKPESLYLTSPCCDLKVPIAYIPSFKCPPKAHLEEKNGNNKPDVNIDLFGSPQNTEYFPDLEGYAWGLLKDCSSATFNRSIFYSKYMIGWKEGDFNKMVYHMLTDQYNANGVESVEGTQEATLNPAKLGVDECGKPIEDATDWCKSGTNQCKQYTCSQVVDCWRQQVILLRNSLCGDSEYDSETGTNVSNRTDEEAGGDKAKHDNHFNDGFSGVKLSRRKKKKLKKKISAMMRSLSDENPSKPYTGFMVKDFLDCTGYKFAKILTAADPKPLPADEAKVKYSVPFGVNTPTTPVGKCPTGGCKSWPYNPPVAWKDIVVVPAAGGMPAKTIKDYFPFVRDPLYAFKYFEYPDANRMRDVELLSCYSDPNDCYKTKADGSIDYGTDGKPKKIPCCFTKDLATGAYSASALCDTPITVPGNGNYSSNGNTVYNLKYYVKNFCDKGKLICPYNADGWSAGQRYSFYNMLRTYVPVPEDPEDNTIETREEYVSTPMGLASEANPLGMEEDEVTDWKTWNGIDANESFEYPTVVKFEMMKMAKTCEGKCEERRNDFRNKLILTFSRNGYIIGGCKAQSNDNVVPEEDIDLLVDEIYKQCKQQCGISTYTVETSVCRKINERVTAPGISNSYIEIEYGVGGCAGNCPGNVTNCNDVACNSEGECPVTSTLSRCEQKKWKQVMEWDFEIDMPSMLDVDHNSQPDGSRKFNCTPNANLADYTVLPNSINTGVPDMNNFRAAKTVSPAVEINLSLPAKN
jgi:hypothetical protein